MKRAVELRIKDRTSVDPTTGCWNWLGRKDKDGYGNMTVFSKSQRTHRLSYKAFIGEIPEGYGVLHKCDNPSCNNPDHLYAGTIGDNMRDKKIRQRIVGEKHPYSKLEEKDVLFIRESTLSQSQLAEQFGVIQAHISRIKRRVSWTHI